MTDPEQQFINELQIELKNDPQKENIIAEYKAHVYDMCHENKNITYEQLVKQLGTPHDIAKMWKQETGITPKKTQWLFILLNILIFGGGGLFTYSYHVLEWEWIHSIWNWLTEVSFLLLLVYMLFWGLVGYEVGKEFGHRGRRLLTNIFFIAIIPNLILMYLIIFKLLPHEWFGSLLNAPFIIICIVATAVLYPVSLLGYYWGRKVSV